MPAVAGNAPLWTAAEVLTATGGRLERARQRQEDVVERAFGFDLQALAVGRRLARIERQVAAALADAEQA